MHTEAENTHKHNNKLATKQQGNKNPSSTLNMNKFTSKPFFSKILN